MQLFCFKNNRPLILLLFYKFTLQIRRQDPGIRLMLIQQRPIVNFVKQRRAKSNQENLALLIHDLVSKSNVHLLRYIYWHTTPVAYHCVTVDFHSWKSEVGGSQREVPKKLKFCKEVRLTKLTGRLPDNGLL